MQEEMRKDESIDFCNGSQKTLTIKFSPNDDMRYQQTAAEYSIFHIPITIILYFNLNILQLISIVMLIIKNKIKIN